MSRPKPMMLLVFLAAVVAALGGISLVSGALFVAKHEGDTLHLLQIVFRMADGEWPHLDFMTPIGILAFWPIAVLVKAGLGIGGAIIAAQIAMALGLLLPTLWLAYSRFTNALGYLFALIVMVLCLALVHGETDQLVSISMHYNRWAWAVAYLVVAAAVLPAVTARNPALDGVIIGLGMSALALIKVTYFISFAPAVLLALLLYKAWKTLGIAALCGLAVVVAMTLLGGIEFWTAYLGDLLTVSRSELRPQPGAPLGTIIGAPAYLGGSTALMAGVVFLRQAGQDKLGLLLLVLAPGFFYVTFQNFGNDPQWLLLLALILLAPTVAEGAKNGLGWPMARALNLTAMAVIAFATPSFVNLAYSPFRNANSNETKYQALLPGSGTHEDLRTRVIRANRADGTIALDGDGSGLEASRELAERDGTRTELMGEALPDCELRLGIVAWFEAIVVDLEANGFAGTKLFTADIFSSYWLYGDFQRLPGGSPWYYGGLPGIEDATHMIVPLCPASQDVRKEVLETVTEAELSLTEVHRSPLYVLVEIGRP